jgi:hypothetical protein
MAAIWRRCGGQQKAGGARAVTIVDVRLTRIHCAQQILLAPFFGTG